jgi:uncharacterized protein (DUF1786 family)
MSVLGMHGHGWGAWEPGGGARVLAVDVGAGTMDVLIAEEGQRPENSVKLVSPSRTVVVARQIAAASQMARRVVFRGPVMGGGACSVAATAHVRAGLELLATETAALTFADDLEHVRRWGVKVVSDDEAAAAVRQGAEDVRSGDVDADALLGALRRLGAQVTFTAAAVAAQDHGFRPHGSNRVFRFSLWEQAIAAGRPLVDLFYRAAAVPPELTRLRAAAGCLAGLEVPLVAADTGPAALLGALPEGVGDAVLVNVGNGHTACVVALAGRLAGVFEHHTSSLDGERLELLLQRFLQGELTGDEVRADGGHGAVLRGPVPPGLPLLVTGPNRQLLAHSRLPVSFPAPFGDTMLTGPVGLVRACHALLG